MHAGQRQKSSYPEPPVDVFGSVFRAGVQTEVFSPSGLKMVAMLKRPN